MPVCERLNALGATIVADASLRLLIFWTGEQEKQEVRTGLWKYIIRDLKIGIKKLLFLLFSCLNKTTK